MMRCVMLLAVQVYFLGLAPPAALALPQEGPAAEVELIQGLDGGEYEPYSTMVIRTVQEALTERGFYSGPINGVLDEEMMEAIGRFQEENGLMVSGVPSPKTRERLFEH